MEDHGLDTKLLERFMRKRFHDAKPADISSVNVASAAPKGDNNWSKVHRVKFVFSTASERKRQHAIIVKTVTQRTGSTSENVNLSKICSSLFRMEIKAYTTLLTSMEDLMEEFGDKRDKLWPDLIGYRPNDMIALEDLTETHYFGAKRQNCMNVEQSLLVLRSLGRFHAMSKVLISRGLISHEDKGQIWLASDADFIEKLWFAYFTALSTGMGSWGEEWKEISNQLSIRSRGVNKQLGSLIENYDKRFEVLNHGDPWTCNLLFQTLEFDDIPVSVKFVDFQNPHINSFICDVVYFLYSSTIGSVRRANFELLQTAYQDSLEKNLKFFNYTGYIPTLEDVKTETKRMEFLGMCSTLLQPILYGATLMDMAKVMTSPEDVLHKSVYSDGKAEESIGEDLKYFYANGVMDVGK